MIYMGIVQMLKIQMYWSSKIFCYYPVIRNIMQREKFLLILRVWHFQIDSSDDSQLNCDCLFNLKPIISRLNKTFKQHCKLGPECVIDKSMILLHGHLLLRQYIPLKSHKYSVKMFTLRYP